jgi:hypothetical protein
MAFFKRKAGRSLPSYRILGGCLAAALTSLLLATLNVAAAPPPSLSVSPASLALGGSVTTSGTRFPKDTHVVLSWDGSTSGMPTTSTAANGSFSVQLTISQTATIGNHIVQATVGGVSATTSVQVVTTTTIALAMATATPTTAGTATATPTTVAIATTINVTSAPYNANSTCSADASTAIQNALNDAAKVAPATVVLGGSCFLTSTALNIPGGVTLAGQGQTATTLKSSQTSGPLMHLTGSAPGLQDFKIDGSSQSQDTHSEWGAWLDHTSNAVVQRLEVWQTKDNAVMIVGGSGNSVTSSLLHGMGWNEPMPGNIDNAAGVWVTGAAQNTTLSGNTLRDMNRQWIHCLVAQPGTNWDNNAQWNGLTVANNSFTNCGLRGYMGGGAMSVHSGTSATISGNDVSNSPDSQIWTDGVGYETIQNNKLYNTDGQHPPGVEASGGLSNFNFIGNACDQQDRCIWMYTGAVNNSNVTVSNNTVTNSNVGTGHALHLGNISGGTIHGNVVQSNCNAGLYMTYDSSLDVQFNTAYGCTGTAAWMDNNSTANVQNNFFGNNPWPGGGFELGGTMNGVTVTCNNVSNDGFTVWNFSSGSNQMLSPNNGVCSTS